ncbi:MAG TPA: hypothetical protein DDZ89_01750 [Clostridiales bacterium]|nr:hypothetical protein [Clostridiales bacterium]
MIEDHVMKDMEVTIENTKKIFSTQDDVKYKVTLIRGEPELKVVIVYIDGMVKITSVNEDIIRPLNENPVFGSVATLQEAYRAALNGGIYHGNMVVISKMEELISTLLSGFSIVVFDELKTALAFETKGFEFRSVAAGQEENTFKSAKEAFVENVRVNVSLVRQKLKTRHLAVHEMDVGEKSNTTCSILYMNNICNEEFVNTVITRIKNIKQEDVLSMQDIYEGLVEHKYTMFPQSKSTESASVLCSSLMEGKIAILMNGIPYGLIFPTVFGDLFNSAFDYNINFALASFFRIMRYASFLMTLLLPGIYVAIAEYHPEMIPFALLNTIGASKAGTPFGTVMEVLLMSFTFYVLIQVSMQVPSSMGSAVSIVGGIVLGQAAVQAQLVSPGVIVVIAAASIAALAIPNKDANFATWIWQGFITILTAVLGLYGLTFGVILLLYSLARLESLGVPYLSPYIHPKKMQLEDSLVRFPLTDIQNRPTYLKPKIKERKKA